MKTFFAKNNLGKKTNYRNGERGFTIVETLVAITILMVSIVGPLIFASNGLNQAIYAKDQITAFYLAQDAVEQRRNVRDTNSILSRGGTPTDWLDGLSSCVGTGNNCKISAVSAPGGGLTYDVSACTESPGNACPPLSYNSITFTYGYNINDGVVSNFTRTINIKKIPENSNDPDGPSHEAEISVTIDWKTGLLSRSFTVRENIFNWAQ